MHETTKDITKIILAATKKARAESAGERAMDQKQHVNWPTDCTVGPGLEGAIACETKIGYVNGAAGELLYRGYDIFDLCAYSTFEEVSYLLVHGRMPTKSQYENYKKKLASHRALPKTLRQLMSFPLTEMNTMAALRLGSNLMRQQLTWRDSDAARPGAEDALGADEDSIPMETQPMGFKHAIYEFRRLRRAKPKDVGGHKDDATSLDSCDHLISGLATVGAAICRIRQNQMPIDPDPKLGHAANLLYMMTGKRPTPVEERIMDVALILHADHGMNASTFAAMVVASTMSDVYFSIGAGIGALNGPLHGGANEAVIKTLDEIGSARKVKGWFKKARRQKRKIAGFGHRVYKTYDPRARVLGPLAEYLAEREGKDAQKLLGTARELEKAVVSTLGEEKQIFPNVDFYSGLVYRSLGIPEEMFTPLFAVSRVSGWSARVLEYLKNNRIFRPRAMYVGEFNQKYVPINRR